MSPAKLRVWLLIFLSATLQVLTFPSAGPVPLWRTSLCWIALVPLLLALVQTHGKPSNVRTACVLGYMCGVCWYFGNCAWIYQTMYLYGGLPKPVSFVILVLFALYLGLYHGVFAALFAVICRSRLGVLGALLVSPFLWVSVELARARITGFPWDLLGNAQVDNLLLIRLAPWAGVMSLSFVIVVINALIVLIFIHSTRSQTYLGFAGFVCAALLQLGGKAAFLSADAQSAISEQKSFTAVLMQENLEVGAMTRSAQPVSAQQEMAIFSSDSLHPTPLLPLTSNRSHQPLTAGKPSVLVWPEAPSHLQSSDPAFHSAMSQLALRSKMPLVIGSIGVDFSPLPPRGYFLYDSAAVFQADGSYQGRYDKIHLVPWGEYIPFKTFFSFARKLTEGVGDMDRGTNRTVFTLDGHRYGIFVCYESIFGNEVREFARNGAQVLVNISDDGWYGDSGAPWQHLNMARMRAIENHRWLLRATNTGVTTAIDPEGRLEAEAPRHVRGAFVFPFSFEQRTTFYTRHGDWFPYLCVLMTILWLGYSSKTRMN